MSLEVKCYNCKKFISQEGAILVSPPAVNDAQAASRYNLCHHCFTTVFDWMRGKGIL